MKNEQDLFFQVSVKCLCFDSEGRVLMQKEGDGTWELPGGRVEGGEHLLDALIRECREESGLVPHILQSSPLVAYSTRDREGRPRIVLCYPVHFNSLDFTESDECVELKFIEKHQMSNINISVQIRKLVEYL